MAAHLAHGADPLPYPVFERIPERVTTQRQSERNENLDALKKIAKASDLHPYLIILENRKWKIGKTLTVAFNGGAPALHAEIGRVASEWSSYANVRFDFGRDDATGQFRSWSGKDTIYKADIRVAFHNDAEPGYWSVVGTESRDPKKAAPSQSSMNLEGFDKGTPAGWEGTVRHEFGHALALEHEHQSPDHPCDWRWNDDKGYIETKDADGEYVHDKQGRLPGLYTVLGGPPNKWKPQVVDFNLKQLTNTAAYGFGPFDKFSIMKYYFASWMFQKKEQSDCFSPGNNDNLSNEDKMRIAIFYPNDPQVADTENSEMLNAVSRLLPQLNGVPTLASKFRTQQRQLQAE